MHAMLALICNLGVGGYCTPLRRHDDACHVPASCLSFQGNLGLLFACLHCIFGMLLPLGPAYRPQHAEHGIEFSSMLPFLPEISWIRYFFGFAWAS